MYLDALKNAGSQGGGMPPNAASPGLGPTPSLPGLPPPPTGTGAMPTGAPTNTKMTAGSDAIASLRTLQGFVPALYNDISEMISRIKGATSDKAGDSPGPSVGDPGIPGAAQLDASPTMDSGGPGAL